MTSQLRHSTSFILVFWPIFEELAWSKTWGTFGYPINFRYLEINY